VPVLLLLPASRRQELRYLLPPMARGLALLQATNPNLEVLVPAGQRGFEKPIAAVMAEAGVRCRIIANDEADKLKPQLCAAADVALTKSGTANLELALRAVPQVTGYRVSRPTAFVARHLLRFNVPHISPVNLVLNERLVPELLQDGLTPEAIAAALEPLLIPGNLERKLQLDGYQRLRKSLGEQGVTQRAASAILDRVIQRSPCA
jgi:lipid-A-disaccharide synthase